MHKEFKMKKYCSFKNQTYGLPSFFVENASSWTSKLDLENTHDNPFSKILYENTHPNF